MKRYQLSVEEPWQFEGPEGQNRVIVESQGIAPGPKLGNWHNNYLLLRVVSPFDFNGERVEQLIAAPRYEGESLQTVRSHGGTVGVARVRPGNLLTPGKPFSQDDVHYIMIGSLTPAV